MRLTFLALLVVSLFVLLLARLWFLQVMAGSRYAELAEGNAIRTITVEAPRGKILDRDGQEIVTNRYAMVVSVQPSEMGDAEQRDLILADLSNLVGVPLTVIKERIADMRLAPLRPKPIAIDVPADIVFYIHENRSTRFPGVYAEQLPVRHYPGGDMGAHLIGYLGQISENELVLPEFAGYRPGDVIGWSGVERQYESVLRGTAGERQLEVNRQNEVLRELQGREPVAGADVRLSIDLDTQRIAEDALRRGIENARTVQDRDSGPGRGGTFKAPAGSVVVIDPRTGDIRAMASYPTFQPSEFVGGVRQEYWDYLQDRGSAFPLINRALSASYPPGSVFKVVSAAAALDRGYLEPQELIACPGQWEFGQQIFRNWSPHDRGHIDVVQALTQSCDTFFYELARQMWTSEQDGVVRGEALSDEARAWGFGERTGIDLPGERPGVIPGRQWRREYWEANRGTYCRKGQTLEQGTYAQLVNADLCENGAR